MSIEDKFPPHKAGLFLSHNEHRSYYQTVAQWEEDFGDNPIGDWISEEQKQKAYKTDSFWSLQWYPNTPIGFNCLFAADLEPLLEAACQP